MKWFLPTLETIRIEPLTWEQLIRDIASVDEHASQGLAMFYDRCLKTTGRNWICASLIIRWKRPAPLAWQESIRGI